MNFKEIDVTKRSLDINEEHTLIGEQNTDGIMLAGYLVKFLKTYDDFEVYLEYPGSTSILIASGTDPVYLDNLNLYLDSLTQLRIKNVGLASAYILLGFLECYEQQPFANPQGIEPFTTMEAVYQNGYHNLSSWPEGSQYLAKNIIHTGNIELYWYDGTDYNFIKAYDTTNKIEQVNLWNTYERYFAIKQLDADSVNIGSTGILERGIQTVESGGGGQA